MSRFSCVVRIVTLVLAVHAPSLSHAQLDSPTRAPGIYTIERETRERWMNARQLPLHTPHVRAVSWIAVDSLTTDSVGRRILVGRTSEGPGYGQPARLTLRADGHVLELDAPVRPTPALLAGARTARDSARMSRWGLIDGPYLRLPSTRLWDVTSVFRPPRMQPGARWIDTLAYNDELQDLRQFLTGVRVYTLVGDTLVGTRRRWTVRDSAAVRYADHVSIEERGVGSATIDRNASGVIVGRFLYDPEIGLFRLRDDTTALRGEARLRYADGRTFVSPTRFDRVQRWSLYDRPELDARIAQLRARNASNSFSIVSVPRNGTRGTDRRSTRADDRLVICRVARQPRSRSAE